MYNLRIDAKYNRFYLGKKAIEDLGNPEFIQMWIRPSDMMLFFHGAESGVRVKINGSKEFALYSKPLMQDMRAVRSDIKNGCSYRLQGMKIGAGICFPMKTMERIDGREVETK